MSPFPVSSRGPAGRLPAGPHRPSVHATFTSPAPERNLVSQITVQSASM
jgi:hypothetical protein